MSQSPRTRHLLKAVGSGGSVQIVSALPAAASCVWMSPMTSTIRYNHTTRERCARPPSSSPTTYPQRPNLYMWSLLLMGKQTSPPIMALIAPVSHSSGKTLHIGTRGTSYRCLRNV